MRSLAPALASLVCAYFLTACGEGTGPEEDADEKPPSLILISLDTLRADHMSLYGYDRATTPNLDTLASESVVYDRAISSSCWTLISHMSMLTGLYPEQHGVVKAKYALSPEVPLLAERLKHQGYQTIGIYKQGWIHPRFGMSRGFDVFEKHEDAIEAGENLRAALDELDPAFPFFLFLHLFDIHSKEQTGPDSPFYDPPAPWDSMFVPDAHERLKGVVFTEIQNDDEKRLTPEQLEALLGLYDGGIAWVDSLLGEWIEDWRARGLLDDTLLVITADHGESPVSATEAFRDTEVCTRTAFTSRSSCTTPTAEARASESGRPSPRSTSSRPRSTSWASRSTRPFPATRCCAERRRTA